MRGKGGGWEGEERKGCVWQCREGETSSGVK